MKESSITQPVIDKCKQIAELWRMEIYEGCWVLNQYKTWKEISPMEQKAEVKDEGVVLIYMIKQINARELAVPIPSISDILQKLDELDFDIYDMSPNSSVSKWGINGNAFVKDNEYGHSVFTEAPSLHEALLSALLEVLRKEKK